MGLKSFQGFRERVYICKRVQSPSLMIGIQPVLLFLWPKVWKVKKTTQPSQKIIYHRYMPQRFGKKFGKMFGSLENIRTFVAENNSQTQ